MRGLPFEADSRSTHGVTVARYDLPRAEAPPIPLHIWDFGGQDIYHGTHALFLRDHAIFALVWERADAPGEPLDEHSTDRPLRYWVDYVRRLGGEERAAVVGADALRRRARRSALAVPEAELRKAFGVFQAGRIQRQDARRTKQRAARLRFVD